jgi:four helix bundle protein
MKGKGGRGERGKRVYVLTASGLFSRDFGLRDQIRRAGVSIPTNIAEGFERASRKEYLNFLNIAKAQQAKSGAYFTSR